MQGPFAERRVKADGFEVRLLEAGDGDPVVYVHGGGGLHLDRSHELLAERHRLVAIELPGFGDSPVNDRTQSLDEMAGTLAEVVEAAGIEPPYSLAGTSLGGACVLHLALRVPARVAALVLIAPAAFRPDGWGPPPPEDMPKALWAHPERATIPKLAPEIAEKQQRLLGRLLGSLDQAALRERLRGLEVPTLVVFGTADGLIPPAMGRVYRENMPNCSYVLLYDAGHELGSDRPEAAAALIDDFLRRREAFVIGSDLAPVAP
ncbi:MAG TPA: alpha/beta fold hydrolase [Solirubrobacteraceae bacterium]|nr:alpha/beta fold hydrolase [Solirubrobacteraceae bacterium]